MQSGMGRVVVVGGREGSSMRGGQGERQRRYEDGGGGKGDQGRNVPFSVPLFRPLLPTRSSFLARGMAGRGEGEGEKKERKKGRCNREKGLGGGPRRVDT